MPRFDFVVERWEEDGSFFLRASLDGKLVTEVKYDSEEERNYALARLEEISVTVKPN